MTVIRPNSITGITSITAQANEINVFRHNGVLAGLQLNGVNHHTSAGVSTFHTVNVLGNLDVAGVLTYQDVTNVDSLGIGTFRTGINVSGGQLDVGSNIKLGNAGVITATSFVGSGANLTGITQTTINSNTNNYLITGTGTANTLQGESNLTFDGSTLQVSGILNVSNNTNLSAELRANGNIRMTNAGPKITFVDSNHNPDYEVGNLDGVFRVRDATSSVDRLTIGSDGNVHINTTDNGTANARLNIEDSTNNSTNTLKLINKPSGANGKARLEFYTETSSGQGCSPYIMSVSGADAGPNASNGHNAGGFEFHTRSGGAGTDNNAIRIRDDGSFEKYGTHGTILLNATGSEMIYSRGGRNQIYANHSNGYFDFHTGGQTTFPAMRIFAAAAAPSGAKVGINTDNIWADSQMMVQAQAGMPGLFSTYGIRLDGNSYDSNKRISNASGVYVIHTTVPANNTFTTVAIGRYHAALLTIRVGDAASKRTMVINYDFTQPAYGVAHLNVITNNGQWNTGTSDIQITSSGSDYAIQVKHNSYYNTSNTSSCHMNFRVC